MEEIRNKIEEITKGFSSSSTMSEKYISKHSVELYRNICDHTGNIPYLSFIERLYYCYNGITEEIVCRTCKVNRTPFISMMDGYRGYCSPKCAATNKDTKEKRKSTVLEIYGTDNVAKNKEVIDKTAITNIEKYGNKFTLANSEVKNKSDGTMLDRYGVIRPLQNKELNDKGRLTNMENHGVRGFFEKVEEVKKIVEDNYGKASYPQTEEYREKVIEHNQTEYGVDWYLASGEFTEKYRTEENKKSNLEKSRLTSLEKWGRENYTQTDEYKDRVKDNENLKKVYDGITETAKKKYLEEGFQFDSLLKIDNSIYIKMFGLRCGHEIFAPYSTIQRRLVAGFEACTVCNPTYKHSTSGAEQKLLEFVQENCQHEIIHRDKSLGIELDVYIPAMNLAFEYNGLYWHRDNKEKHIAKTEICIKNGVQLIHIWEDNWLYNKELVKSMIINRLFRNTVSMRAGKCSIKEVGIKESNEFLDNNHIQGKCSNASIRLGLYNNGILVSIMCFSSSTRSCRSHTNSIELVRFCSVRYTTVHGAASKLFKYFVENRKGYDSIISFADRSIFNGNLYRSLGFECVYTTPIDYWWVVDGIRKNKQMFNKKRLAKLIGETEDSESTIMENLGYFKVWNCGLDKYIYGLKANGDGTLLD